MPLQPLRAGAIVGLPDGTSVAVAVADTPLLRARGLMFREAFGDVAGMLFVFERSGRHAFWMRHTPVPLDILWLDMHWTIGSIAVHASPCAVPPCPIYAPERPAKYALEAPAGFVQTHGLQVGDQVTITLTIDD
jgi:uncharacterized protein